MQPPPSQMQFNRYSNSSAMEMNLSEPVEDFKVSLFFSFCLLSVFKCGSLVAAILTNYFAACVGYCD